MMISFIPWTIKYRDPVVRPSKANVEIKPISPKNDLRVERNEDMIDLGKFLIYFFQLYLRTFFTINRNSLFF
jgi:hypothetical protein